jgi:hypothetical protein
MSLASSTLFYELEKQDRSFVDFAEGNDWEGVICPISEGHRRAGKRITPLTLEIIRPKQVDFSWTFLSDVVISERALSVLRAANITGFEVKPVKLVVPTKARFRHLNMPELWELVVTGSGGPAHSDSRIELADACAACGYRRYAHHGDGIVVDEANWDGSDIFVVKEYTKYVLVTERTKEVIKRNKLTNVRFVPSHQIWKNG